jgi:hypothetical protein
MHSHSPVHTSMALAGCCAQIASCTPQLTIGGLAGQSTPPQAQPQACVFCSNLRSTAPVLSVGSKRRFSACSRSDRSRLRIWQSLVQFLALPDAGQFARGRSLLLMVTGPPAAQHQRVCVAPVVVGCGSPSPETAASFDND